MCVMRQMTHRAFEVRHKEHDGGIHELEPGHEYNSQQLHYSTRQLALRSRAEGRRTRSQHALDFWEYNIPL